MSNLKADAQNAANKAVKEARSTANDAEGIVQHYRNEAGRVRDDFIAEVRDRPLRTLGIAAMVGFAMGVIWKI